jgi:hypothetical protein
MTIVAIDALASWATWAKPHKPPPPPPPSDVDPLLLLGGIIGGVVAIVALSFWFYWYRERRQCDGHGILQRRRVLRSGLPGEATVLSEEIVSEAQSTRGNFLRRIIYEVRPASGEPPFRAKGFERMWMSEAHDQGLRVGHVVQVRYDPVDHLVRLVPQDLNEVRRRKDAAVRAREEALLRGDAGR